MHVKLRALSLVVALVTLTPALTIVPAGAAVKQKVSITLTSASVKAGQTTHIKGHVSPAARGKPIRLQRFYGNAWHGYAQKHLTTKSTYDFAVTLKVTGVSKFRVASPHAFSKAVRLSVIAPPRPPGPPHNPPQ
jgi:hypothetical protein